MNRLLLFALLLLPALGSHAQEVTSSCFTEALMARYAAETGESLAQPASAETFVQRDDDMVIPVVVHVVWNQSYLNIPDGVIMYILNQLDEDFNMENTNSSSVRPVFQSVRANAGIRFCLAEVDPAGNPTTGIEHFQTTATWFNPNTQADAMKMPPLGLSAWDPTRYLNIWVCDLNGFSGAGVGGYSYLPVGTMPGSWRDGVVVDALTGFSTTLRTFTHEVGHYLGLKHPFEGNSCTPGDGFSDTPPTNSATFSCSNTSLMKCGALTQYENFMDYSGCGAMFTVQQTTYMQGILNGLRASMLSALPACVVQAGIAGRSVAQVRVFPNPARGQLNITGLPAVAIKAHLFDRAGREVRSEWLRTGSSTIDLVHIAAGSYVLLLDLPEAPVARPVVVME